MHTDSVLIRIATILLKCPPADVKERRILEEGCVRGRLLIRLSVPGRQVGKVIAVASLQVVIFHDFTIRASATFLSPSGC